MMPIACGDLVQARVLWGGVRRRLRSLPAEKGIRRACPGALLLTMRMQGVLGETSPVLYLTKLDLQRTCCTIVDFKALTRLGQIALWTFILLKQGPEESFALAGGQHADMLPSGGEIGRRKALGFDSHGG